MSDHDQKHQGHGQHQGHKHEGHAHGHPNPAPRKGLHKDWRVWAGLILMIAALAIYALTVDESFIPFLNTTRPVTPAAP